MDNKNKVFTVKELNSYIKRIFDQDQTLSSLWLRGEISNFNLHSSGHMYFTLKDQEGSIRAVMFRGRGRSLKFKPTHGVEILALGYVSIYEPSGQYQFYVEEMFPAGFGNLHLAYEELKRRLEKEGVFARAKRPIPFLPQRIGIVTSPTGAALRDILSIVQRRNKSADVLIVPATVQGIAGARSIVQALEILYQQEIDVIIVARGGGSLEELWCFNEESVVRKVSVSSVPIISAVGHETDFTLTDFASDYRAATPSMAAELVAPLREDLIMQLQQLETRILYLINQIINNAYQSLDLLTKYPLLKDPYRLLAEKQVYVDQFQSQMCNLAKELINKENHRLLYLSGILDTLSPLKTLDRGYSIAFRQDKQIISNLDDVAIGDQINVLIKQGFIKCLVEAKEEDFRWKKN